MRRELPIPASVAIDTQAVELVRVWAASGSQHVSIATDLWRDPAAWGIMLVDLAKHVSKAYAERQGQDEREVMRRIKTGFDAEWYTPTDEPKGKIVG